MRSLTPYPALDVARSATVGLWRGRTTNEIVTQGVSADVDLTDNATRIRTGHNKASIDVSYDVTFLDCDKQPRPGDVIGVKVDGEWRSITIVDSIDNFVAERGVRKFTVTARSRDGVGGWRTTSASSGVFPLGSNYLSMMNAICSSLMALDTDEYHFPALQYSVPHSNVQFSAMTPWEMLERIAMAGNLKLSVDVLNSVTAYSKNLLRLSNIEIPNEQVVEFSVGRKTQTVGSVRIDWLDPHLQKYVQSSQVLGSEVMTAGFFKLKVEREVWFSNDRTQRAENTFMKIIDSANNGLLGIKVVDEDYEQKTAFYGEIGLTTPLWVPTLFIVGLGLTLGLAGTPDIVSSAPGATTPTGRLAFAGSLMNIIAIILGIGTGTYEVWGTPYDYAHGKNVTVARGENIPAHSLSEKTLESSLMVSENHAQATSISELMFQNAQGYGFKTRLLDDPRIEVGDILQFEDGSRMLVQGFGNDFTRGSAAMIEVDGFLI